MLKIWLSVFVLMPLLQNSSGQFYVDKVVVTGGYDARYIFRHQNVILPPDKLLTKTDLACFLSELRESGIIADLRIKMRQRRSNTRTLILTPIYHHNINRFVISEITLEGLPEVDASKFREMLHERDLSPGVPLLKYYYAELEKRINQSLRGALPQDSVNQYQGPAWITIRPAGPRKVRVIVSASYTGCGNSETAWRNPSELRRTTMRC